MGEEVGVDLQVGEEVMNVKDDVDEDVFANMEVFKQEALWERYTLLNFPQH